MGYLPNDPNVALGTAIALVKAEEHRRGVWAPIDDQQGHAIQKVIAADSRGQLTKADVVGRLCGIARSMG